MIEEITPELRARIQRLLDLGIRGVSIGDNPNVTTEQVVTEIERCLEAIERGDYEEIVCVDRCQGKEWCWCQDGPSIKSNFVDVKETYGEKENA